MLNQLSFLDLFDRIVKMAEENMADVKMATSSAENRKVLIAVDGSKASQKAMDCKCFSKVWPFGLSSQSLSSSFRQLCYYQEGPEQGVLIQMRTIYNFLILSFVIAIPIQHFCFSFPNPSTEKINLIFPVDKKANLNT